MVSTVRLLQHNDTGNLTPCLASDYNLSYAILSYIWGPEEVIFIDLAKTYLT